MIPLAGAAGGVRVTVRLTPKAAHDRIDGIASDADGQPYLKVSVTAVPEDGKANKALIKLLAKAWHLPKTSLDVIQGATDRRKVLFIEGRTQDLLDRLTQWMAALT